MPMLKLCLCMLTEMVLNFVISNSLFSYIHITIILSELYLYTNLKLFYENVTFEVDLTRTFYPIKVKYTLLEMC